MNPQFTNISNWKELCDQMGLDKAKEVSKKLVAEVKSNGAVAVIATNYNDESYCIFDFVKIDNNKAVYEFTGTAG